MGKKEQFLAKDRLIRGVTDDGYFRISVVKTTDVVRTAANRHGLSLLASVILGRTLTGVIMLASNLKGEERVQLQLEGDGPLRMVVAEATSHGEVRGYVGNPYAELDYTDGPDLGEGIGNGLLNFSKVLYNEAQPITGTVSLVKGNVSEDLAHYLLQSEQVPSAISLDVGIDEQGYVEQAGGVMIQALPSAPETRKAELEESLKNMPVINRQLHEGEKIDDIIDRVTGPYQYRELDRFPVHFFCRCNRDRFKNALRMLDLEELKEMQDDGQELVCHYCGERYHVSSEEIRQIINENKIKLN